MTYYQERKALLNYGYCDLEEQDPSNPYTSNHFRSSLIVLSEAASTYNTKFSKTIQQVINEIQKRKDWIGVDWAEDISDTEDGSSSAPKKTVRLLDYACGTGLVSRVCTLPPLPLILR